MNEARILVVDDEALNRELLSALLAPEGHIVDAVADGASALESLELQPYDLVLLDVRMPHLDGIETCRRIRRNPRFQALPVVFVTAVSDSESRIAGKAVGCNEFLSKPFDRAELLVRIRSLLKAKRYHDAREDTVDQLADELAEARQQVQGLERRASLGTLASGVGHELNNMVAVLMMGLQALRQGFEVDEVVDELDAATAHIADYANELLDFGRPGPDYDEEVDLRDVVHRTLAVLRLSGRTRGYLVGQSLPGEPVMCTVNRVRIEQVLFNLVTNAVDASARGSKIWVRLTVRGDRALLGVVDAGCGIPPERQARIFDAFYTTKSSDKGTGLGLPVVAQIVAAYAGEVSLVSHVGVGTTVTVDLPLA